MSKQISLRSVKGDVTSLDRVFAEVCAYLATLGFNRTNLVEMQDTFGTCKSVLFQFDTEKVFVTLNANLENVDMSLLFKDLNAGFIYDILELKMRQIVNTEGDHLILTSK
jgi:hypothetical protein